MREVCAMANVGGSNLRFKPLVLTFLPNIISILEPWPWLNSSSLCDSVPAFSIIGN